MDAALARLREQGRRAVRVADLDCRSGRRLARVVRRARSLGFVSVEAHGVAATREQAAVAARSCGTRRDLAVELVFDATAVALALEQEVAEAADVIILPSGWLAKPTGTQTMSGPDHA